MRWMAGLFVFLTASLSAAGPARDFGQMVAVKVIGEVSAIDDDDGSETPLHNNDVLFERYTVVTQSQASVVLLFSNGASVRVMPNTRLALEVFRQDPLTGEVEAASLKSEPTASETKLNLAYGEIVCEVCKLRASTNYSIKTPVGAAGIRGTQFRLLHRELEGDLQQFALSTQEGLVHVDDDSGSGGVDVPAGREVGGRLRTGIKPRLNRVQPREISLRARKLIEHVTPVMREAARHVRFRPADRKLAPNQRPKIRRDPAQRREKDNDLKEFSKDDPDWNRPGRSAPDKTNKNNPPARNPPTRQRRTN